MADRQEKAADLGTDIAQDESSSVMVNVQEQSADLRMASAQDESLDSRTSLVGRKRDLQDSTQDQERNGANDSSNEERSRKRVKENYELSDSAHDEDGLVTNISSPLHVQSTAEVEIDTTHQHLQADKPSVFALLRTEAEKGRAPDVESQSHFALVDDASDSSRTPHNATQSTTVPRTWNAGIQSGLRTSFGNKNRPRKTPQSSDISIQPDSMQPSTSQSRQNSESENSGLASNVKPPSRTPSSQSPLVPPVAAPFRVLSETEVANLRPEEKGPYLKALFGHLQSPATSKSVTPNLETEMGSSEDDSSDENDDDDDDDDEDEDEEEHTNNDSLLETAQSKPPPATSTVPPPFVKLTKKKRRELDDLGRAAYDKAYASHLAQARLDRRTAKDAKRIAKTAATGPDLPSSQTVATSQEIAPTRKQRLAQDKQLALQRNTAEADRVFAHGRPLSQKLADKIGSGLSFYARRKQRENQTYSNRHGAWNLNEVLDADGNPFKVHDFSFNLFAPGFLGQNRGNWLKLTDKMLVAAFGVYISNFYNHVPAETEQLRRSATAKDAMSLEAAKVQSSQAFNNPISKISTNLTPATSGSLNGHLPIQDTPHLNLGNSENSLAAGDVSRHLQGQNKPMAGLEVHRVEAADQVSNGRIAPTDEDVVMGEALHADVAVELGSTAAVTDETEAVNIELLEVEMFLQQKYFPSSNSTMQRCLSCARTGHNTSSCPELSCTACGTHGEHSNSMCPKNKRCVKCRERGHKTSECAEKLSLPRSEMACDICDSRDHLEIACHYVWRSFNPRPEEIFTVGKIPVNCYTCGSNDHYGPECGLHTGVVLSGGITWSKGNLQKYIDYDSKDRALSAGIDYSIPKKGFSIKGKANDPITLDDSSNEEPQGFIRPKIEPGKPHGQIQVNRKPRSQNRPAQLPGGQNIPKGSKNSQNSQARNLPPRAARPTFPPRDVRAPHQNFPSSQQGFLPPNHQSAQGMLPFPMRGSNNGSGGSNIGNTSNGDGLAELARKRAKKAARAERKRAKNEAAARNPSGGH